MSVIKREYDDGYLTVLESPVTCKDCQYVETCLLWVLDFDIVCDKKGQKQ